MAMSRFWSSSTSRSGWLLPSPESSSSSPPVNALITTFRHLTVTVLAALSPRAFCRNWLSSEVGRYGSGGHDSLSASHTASAPQAPQPPSARTPPRLVLPDLHQRSQQAPARRRDHLLSHPVFQLDASRRRPARQQVPHILGLGHPPPRPRQRRLVILVTRRVLVTQLHPALLPRRAAGGGGAADLLELLRGGVGQAAAWERAQDGAGAVAGGDRAEGVEGGEAGSEG